MTRARAAGRAATRRVRALYEQHPYPSLPELRRPLDERFHRDRLNYVLHRRPGAGFFGDAMRIWVPGCGTDQAIEVAMRFPRARVLATDVSRKALAVTRSLTRSLGLANVEIAERDMLDARYRDVFDLVLCVGVLHHLPDPARGFRVIRRSLRRSGAGLVMVYNEAHRREVRAFQAALQRLCPSDALGPRLTTAKRLLRAASSSRCDPVGPFFRSLEADLASGRLPPSALFDTLIHPLEVAYDVDGLMRELAGAGLRLAAWRWPRHWDLSLYVSDEALLDRFYRLEAGAQFSVVCALAGAQAPFFDCWVERDDAPAWRPLGDRELSALRPRPRAGETVYGVRAGRVVRSETRRWTVDELGASVACEGRIRTEWPLPRGSEAVVARCDGRTTVRELCGAERDVPVLELVELLLSPEVELLAPTYDAG